MAEKKRTSREMEIHRLFGALKNFLSFGYDKEYQSHESAIEQLTKLRDAALRKRKQEVQNGK